MENYSKYVKIGVAVIVVIFIILVIYKLYNRSVEESEQTWPEEISNCPDYWTDLGNGKCKNVHNLGTCTNGKVQPTITFNKSYYDGDKGKMNRCRWAKKCNVSWEGIDDLCA